MGANSKIEWCDATFNPWYGCTKVSPACDHCYAESWAKRSGLLEDWGKDRRRSSESSWRQPLKWNAKARTEGRRWRVFCASLADVFDNQIPTAWRLDLWALIRATPHLDWLLLTKRPQNIQGMIPWGPFSADGPWPNVWLGTTPPRKTAQFPTPPSNPLPTPFQRPSDASNGVCSSIPPYPPTPRKGSRGQEDPTPSTGVAAKEGGSEGTAKRPIAGENVGGGRKEEPSPPPSIGGEDEGERAGSIPAASAPGGLPFHKRAALASLGYSTKAINSIELEEAKIILAEGRRP